MGRIVACLAASLLLRPLGACGDDAPEPGIRVDRPDSGDLAADADAGSPRLPGGPVLPAADDELVLPFGEADVEYPISVAAQPGVLDVHFSVDTTASISAEIDRLQLDMARTIAPGLRARVARVSFGVSRFADFPHAPFGYAGGVDHDPDIPFELLTPITDSISRVTSAIARLDQPLNDGGDLPEAGAEALFQIATGDGYVAHGMTLIRSYHPDADNLGGGVGFRSGALRVVLHVTDAPSHGPDDYGDLFPATHDMNAAGNALVAVGAKLVAIVSGACSTAGACERRSYKAARAELEVVARATGALGESPSNGQCPHGVEGKFIPALDGTCPLVFDVDEEGRGLSQTVLDGIVRLLDGIRFGVVDGQISDDPLGFVHAIIPIEADRGSAQGTADLVDRLPAGHPDGQLDSFANVHAKTRMVFHVVLRNDRIHSSDVDQVFRAVVTIAGDGLVLERRTLRLVVPAGSGLAPPRDADAGP